MGMKAFFLALTQFLRDDTGALSSMRLLFLAWGLVALVVWAVICFKTATVAALPWSLTSFIVSLIGGKVLQSWTESIGQPTPPTVVTPPVVVPTTPPIVVDNPPKNDIVMP